MSLANQMAALVQQRDQLADVVVELGGTLPESPTFVEICDAIRGLSVRLESTYAAVYGCTTLVIGQTRSGSAPKTYDDMPLSQEWSEVTGCNIETWSSESWDDVPWVGREGDALWTPENRESINRVIVADPITPMCTANWFRGLTGCTEMDLSLLDTSKTASMTDMFRGCSALEEITLGVRFSFTGDGSTSCVLPGDCWKGSSGTIFTSAELSASYDGTTMAGAYEKQPFVISASWDGGEVTSLDPINLTQMTATAYYSDGSVKELAGINKSAMAYSHDASYPWTQSDGVWQSGCAGISNGISTMSVLFTLEETATLSFDWAVSSDSEMDGVYYTITKDGSVLTGTGSSTLIKGNESVTNISRLNYTRVTKSLEPGEYKLTFTYSKNTRYDSGLDAGFVKNITVDGLSFGERYFAVDGLAVSPSAFSFGMVGDQEVTVSYTESNHTATTAMTIPVSIPHSAYAAVYGGDTLVFGQTSATGNIPASYNGKALTESWCKVNGYDIATAAYKWDNNLQNYITPWHDYNGKITSVDVVDLVKPKSGKYMFSDLKNCTSMDLALLDTSNTTNMDFMFSNCYKLTTIYASNLWSTDAVTSSTNMFRSCTNLKGDIAFDSNYVDKTCAKTSGGYLTYKAAP